MENIMTNKKDKEYIIKNIEQLSNKYDEIYKLLRHNKEARQYFENAVIDLDHCVDSLVTENRKVHMRL